jgi:hypothetical protein
MRADVGQHRLARQPRNVAGHPGAPRKPAPPASRPN